MWPFSRWFMLGGSPGAVLMPSNHCCAGYRALMWPGGWSLSCAPLREAALCLLLCGWIPRDRISRESGQSCINFSDLEITSQSQVHPDSSGGNRDPTSQREEFQNHIVSTAHGWEILLWPFLKIYSATYSQSSSRLEVEFFKTLALGQNV